MEMRTGFGWIEIHGQRYEKDVVVHVDGSITKRRKKLSKPLREKYGHTPLSEAEVEPLLDEGPEVVMVGTGQYGDLPLTPGARELLERRRATVAPTPELLPVLTRALRDGEKTVAILHLTC